MSWLWKYNKFCAYSYPLCYKIASSGIGDHVDWFTNDHATEIDYSPEITGVPYPAYLFMFSYYRTLMRQSAYLAEYLGSFFFIFAILMSGGNAFVIGGALVITVLLVGDISGAHVNPAVSVAQYLRGSLRPSDLLSFVAVQLLGGVSAYYAYHAAK